MVVYIGVTTMGNVTVQPTTADADATYIAAAVGGAGGLLVMALVVAVFIAAIALRNRQSKHGNVQISNGLVHRAWCKCSCFHAHML